MAFHFRRVMEIRLHRHQLAFYTVFCGTSENVANQVQDPPSKVFPSFFFTDNNTTFTLAEQQGWVAMRLGGHPSGDDIVSNMKAKDVKARPHSNPVLKHYRYTVYLDSKLSVTDKEVIAIMRAVPKGKPLAVRLHNILSPPMNVWEEFELAMTQRRYQKQRDQMKAYVEDKIGRGYKDTLQFHFWCSFIIRDMAASVVEQIGEMWFQEILKCGIDDQLSMFFVYQDYADAFHPLARHTLPYSQWH